MLSLLLATALHIGWRVETMLEYQLKHLGQLETMLECDEGKKSRPYLDSKQNWTIGIGHLIGKRLEDLKLSEREIRKLLEADIEEANDLARSIFGDYFQTLDGVRQNAILSMIFQLGDRFLGFEDTIDAIRRGDWKRAEREALDSKWARIDSPDRARRIAGMLRSGKYDPKYGLA